MTDPGGTIGAQDPSRGFAYSIDERRAILGITADGPGIIQRLEAIATAYLQTPTTHERKKAASEEATSYGRINAATAELLAALEAGGHWSSESLTTRAVGYETRADLVSQLLRLQDWTEAAADEAREAIPHASSNWSWQRYLFNVCDFWSAALGRKVARRRTKTGDIAGPMVDYLVAVAGPVKVVRAPENLTGAMTSEMAGHAIAAYKKTAFASASDASLRDLIIAAALRDKR